MGLIGNVMGALRRSRSGSFRGEGSSRRGKQGLRYHDDPSGKAESSTHSALFDLELSSRGRGNGIDLLARLNSTVHDEGSAHGGEASVRLPSGLLQRVIYLGRPVMEFELDLLQDVRALRSTCQLQPDGQLDLACLVDQLHDLGYACYLKRNNPGDPQHRHNIQPSCMEKLRHEFIVVAGRSDGSLSHWCLVDPRFREQFAIAQPTPAYDRLLKAVPLEFVGTPLRLQALVEALCAEMAEAFASQQLTLPPWRKFSSMLSKWFDPEEMPGAAPPLPPLPVAGATAPAPAQAAAGLPLSAFAAAAGHGGGALPPAPAAAVTAASRPQTLLQQQAAAALAERQSSGGGSQDFFEAVEMHKQSMRLQEQAAAAGANRGSPARLPLSPQQGASPPQHPQQTAAPAALSSENLRQLDVAFSSRPEAAAAGSRGSGQREGSNKPRRRRPPPAGFAMASGGQQLAAAAQAAVWDDDELSLGPFGLPGLAGVHAAQAQLQNSGSWSELSTILESRSNGSSPAAAALMAAGNAQLGTSCTSRRSTSCAMVGAGSSMAAAPLRRSPGRPEHSYAQATSAASSDVAAGTVPASPATSLVGFGPPPLSKSPLAKSSAALSSIQPPSLDSRAGSTTASPPRAMNLPLGVASVVSETAVGTAQLASGEGSSRGGKKKVVSLLAKGLKSVGHRQTWSGLLPAGNTVRRTVAADPSQRSWTWRGGSEDGSSRSGRNVAVVATAATTGSQSQA